MRLCKDLQIVLSEMLENTHVINQGSYYSRTTKKLILDIRVIVHKEDIWWRRMYIFNTTGINKYGDVNQFPLYPVAARKCLYRAARHNNFHITCVYN